MELGLTGKVALVTGGSKGIGAAISRNLANEGVKVAFCARESNEMSKLKTQIETDNGICLPIIVDVFNPDDIIKCVKKVVNTFGGLDILINNVGGAIRQNGFEDLTDEEWMRAYELNVMSVVRFTRTALPHLRNSILRRIINISSISAIQPGLYSPHYIVTKAAVVNLTKHLSKILAKEKILVNVVCPGPVHSEAWNQNIESYAIRNNLSLYEATELIEHEEVAKIPIGKVGECHHIASLVTFLASPLSEWTTGSCFHINGGKLSCAL